MNRKLTASALALTLLGGVYMACGTANASNMGFKLERSFPHVSGNRNNYFVSFPLFNGLGDVCDESNATNACQGQVGGAGDGFITGCDAICDMWTGLADVGSDAVFSMTRISPTCGYSAVTIQKDFLGTAISAGQMTMMADHADIGWWISVTQTDDTENRAVIVGSHDPGFDGRDIPAFADCNSALINLPYHSMYKTVNEVLCGLEVIDWVDEVNNLDASDMNPDGKPDTCTGGIFDEADGSQVAVNTIVGNGFVAGIAVVDFLGFLDFPGTNYDLKPGEAYLVNSTETYPGGRFLSPHF